MEEESTARRQLTPLFMVGVIILGIVGTIILSFEVQKNRIGVRSRATETDCTKNITASTLSGIGNGGILQSGQAFECRVETDAPYTDVICGYKVGNANWPKNCPYSHSEGDIAVFVCDPTQPTDDNLPLPVIGDVLTVVAMRGDQALNGKVCKNQWDNASTSVRVGRIYYIDTPTVTPAPPSQSGATATPPPQSGGGTGGATPTPTCSAAPATPGNMQPNGFINAANPVTVSWNAVGGAARYALRIDDQSNGWVGDCSKTQLPGDICNDNVTATSFQYQAQPNRNYAMWVHAINTPNDISCTAWSAAGIAVFNTNIAVPTPTSTPQVTATPVPTATPTPVATQPTITPTPTPTPAPGNVVITMKLKFQGITQQPVAGWDRMNVHLQLRNITTGALTDLQAPLFTYDNGVWIGKTVATIPTDPKYLVYVKGPQHIQKRVCNINPKESSSGSYHCSNGGITLHAGDNMLDFSGIYQLVGDLPPQDGIVNSQDIAFVRNNLGSTDDEVRRAADLNRDGIVNVRDFALILESLASKADDE